jgi:hypothetical protein
MATEGTNEEGLTIINGEAPPTIIDLNNQFNNIIRGLELWDRSVSNGLATSEDKKHFYMVMEAFNRQIPPLVKAYYDLVESTNKSAEIQDRFGRSGIFSPNPEFLAVVKMMNGLKDVKKKWRRHLKPFGPDR